MDVERSISGDLGDTITLMGVPGDSNEPFVCQIIPSNMNDGCFAFMQHDGTDVDTTYQNIPCFPGKHFYLCLLHFLTEGTCAKARK